MQPVIAKIILPWFGGSAAVWTTCLLFFQMVLLLGYLYAHAVVRYCKPRVQMIVHIALLLLSAAGPAHLPQPSLKPSGAARPHLRHPGTAGPHRRVAVLPALHHRSAAAGLVCAHA